MLPDRHSKRRYLCAAVARLDRARAAQVREAFRATFSIAHRDGERVVQHVLQGWRRRPGVELNLEGVVREITDTCRRYRISEVAGDRYSAGWVKQSFQKAGIRYRQSTKNKSELYLEAMPLFAEGRVDLLDHRHQARELQLLERRPRAGGKDLLDHPRGLHDDFANVLALAAWEALERQRRRITVGEFSI